MQIGTHPRVLAIVGEAIKVFALTRRSESAASSINRDNGKTAAPVPKEEAQDHYKTDEKVPLK